MWGVPAFAIHKTPVPKFSVTSLWVDFWRIVLYKLHNWHKILQSYRLKSTHLKLIGSLTGPWYVLSKESYINLVINEVFPTDCFPRKTTLYFLQMVKKWELKLLQWSSFNLNLIWKNIYLLLKIYIKNKIWNLWKYWKPCALKVWLNRLRSFFFNFTISRIR